MLFSSSTFIFLFLPACLLAYYGIACPLKRYSGIDFRNAFLLFASLVFYAWGEVFYVLLMIASITVHYVFGLLICYFRSRQPLARSLLVFAVSTNLLSLCFFKYANFIADNLNLLLEFTDMPVITIGSVHLPLGISFFTFQAMSYVIDVYRNEAPVQKNPFNIALYIALFPQLIAGPIVRYHDVALQINDRESAYNLFFSGMRRFILGLAKKMLIANTLGEVADQIFALSGNELSTPVAWLGIICYALQIYFDFSAYSDMAIGLGRMFGFRFLENFNYPYISASVQEFWRRWHISLSSWFRDYLYIPLGGSRVAPWRIYFNLCLVFFLCGLWHGASWNFVIWGLIHGAFLVIERLGFDKILQRLWRPVRHCYTLLVVLVGWVFFRAETLDTSLHYTKTLMGLSSLPSEQIDAFLFFL
ncbi:MAG: MBOAT family protein [Pseudomonadales bacterium]|nr:MBOAT family protein [Pseudomonadales bacterium]